MVTTYSKRRFRQRIVMSLQEKFLLCLREDEGKYNYRNNNETVKVKRISMLSEHEV
jgi:hypothetical protein